MIAKPHQEGPLAAKTVPAPVFQTNVLSPIQRPAVAATTNEPRTLPQVPAEAVATVGAPSPTQETKGPPANHFPRPVRDVAEAQIALARLGISSGSVDGVMGAQTHMALAAFQKLHQLPETGKLEPTTCQELVLTRPPLSHYIVSESDLRRLQPLSKTWAGKAQQTALEYESILELLAEKTRASPGFLRQLNPPGVFRSPVAGATVNVPDTELAELTSCEFIRIYLSRRMLEAFDARSNLVAHFPCSIAQRVEKRPEGELHVVSIAPDPNYTFDPALFPDAAEPDELGGKLILPPGPNNPVGVAWIGLDKPGYGIHGTSSPEQVGRTESHGCFRLSNWNAEHLLKIIHIGVTVYVER